MQEENDEREMMEGLQREHRVRKVRNLIGNHIPMSESGHRAEITIRVRED